jgi:acyl-CoA reductase-like NAD-dependent aldehyde dehydrogenase
MWLQRWPSRPCTKPRPEVAAGCTINTMALKLENSRVTAGSASGQASALLPLPMVVEQARAAQAVWEQTALRARLSILRRTRHRIATTAVEMAQSVPCEQSGALHRSVADTLVSEVLPLVEACRFLEREAGWILAPQRLSTHARPFWLRRVVAESSREPLGVVLIIAPANYPLFLPGVQALQALAAGNAVLWKPAPGTGAAAAALRAALVASGLDPALLQLFDESPQAAADAIAGGVDKVFLTGSAATGTAILSQLAPQLTPAVMELSGCDAVFVLAGADLERVVEALVFGLRLNGSATCMAPRRLFLVGSHPGLIPALLERLKNLPAVALPPDLQARLADLLDEARRLGATVQSEQAGETIRYAVIRNATPQMRIAQSDIFAPVLCIFEVADIDAALAAHAPCPYALTAAIFGPASAARALAARLPVGTVLINDLIVATADPRIGFGGRKSSGFGVTRGREGLLEMTALKTVVVERSRDLRAYRPTTFHHEPFFAAYLEAVHGGTWRARWRGLRRLLRAAPKVDG